MMGKFFREPIVHFLVIGGLIYLAYGVLGENKETPANRTITVTAAEIDWLETSWQKRWNRPPTRAELQGLIDNYVRETVLYRAALAMGFDKDDVIIRRRLGQKLEFLSQDLAAPDPPTIEELERYFAAHLGRYRADVLTTFTHVCFDPDRRGQKALADAEKTGVRLASLGGSAGDAADYGDRFMLQSY